MFLAFYSFLGTKMHVFGVMRAVAQLAERSLPIREVLSSNTAIFNFDQRIFNIIGASASGTFSTTECN